MTCLPIYLLVDLLGYVWHIHAYVFECVQATCMVSEVNAGHLPLVLSFIVLKQCLLLNLELSDTERLADQ